MRTLSKPHNIIIYMLALIMLLALGAQVLAADTSKGTAPAEKSSKNVLKADNGDKDFLNWSDLDAKEAPKEKEAPLYVTLLSFIFKLAVVLALAYGTIYGLKKFNGIKGNLGNSRQRIKVVENTTLGANRALHLVEIGSKKLLVASTPNHVNLVTELGEEEIPEVEAPEQGKNFKDQLSTFMGKKPDTTDSAKNVAQMLHESSMLLQEKILQVGRLRKKFRDA